MIVDSIHSLKCETLADTSTKFPFQDYDISIGFLNFRFSLYELHPKFRCYISEFSTCV